MGTQLPAPQKGGGQSSQFSVHVCCDQTAGWIKMPLGTEVDLGPGHIVLDGNPAPPQKKRWHNSPYFYRPMYCGQTAEWIKIPLGTKVQGSPLPRPHSVRCGSSSPPPEKGHSSLQFSAHICCGQTAGWLKMPLGTEVDLGPGHINYVRWGPSPPPPERGTAVTCVRPISIVAKRSPISAAAKHLLCSPYGKRQAIIMAALCNRGPLYFCPVVSFFYLLLMVALCNRADHYIFAL